MAYDNTNRGSIWKNDKKQTENHPDFTGSLDVDGVEYWVSAWKRKEGANPKAPPLSFSIKRKDATPAQQQNQQPASQNSQDPFAGGGNDSDIPF